MRYSCFSLLTIMSCVLLVCFGGTRSVAAASRYQVQIGSAKQLEGTRYFTRKASTVLAMPAYIIMVGDYYTVLVGDYASREQAAKELVQIKKHYNGMVVSYDAFEVLGAYENGREIDSEAVASVTGPALTEKSALKEEPVRVIDKSELSSLDTTLEANIDNIIVEGCRLSNEETLAEYLFATTCMFKDLDPKAISIEEKHGENIYIHVEALHRRPLILMRQLKQGQVNYERKDARLVLRSKTKNKKTLSKTVHALRDLIYYCARKKK